METREYVTLFVLIATIISSHLLASKQTRKNKKAKWIEDLRLEVANLISLSQQVTKDVNTLFPFSKSGFVVAMLLDQNKKLQEDLILEVQDFGLFVTTGFNLSQITEYKDRVTKITNLTKYIIFQEEKRL